MDGNVDLGAKLEEAVSELVERGAYGSREEVLRMGVRLVAEREAKLAALAAEIAVGAADADAGRTHSTREVVAFLHECLRDRPAA